MEVDKSLENNEVGNSPIELVSLTIRGSYNLKDGKSTQHTCGLCRGSLLLPPLSDIEKNILKIEFCKGACGHIFHKNCIETFQGNGSSYSCPIDKTPWNIAELFTIKETTIQ